MNERKKLFSHLEMQLRERIFAFSDVFSFNKFYAIWAGKIHLIDLNYYGIDGQISIDYPEFGGRSYIPFLNFENSNLIIIKLNTKNPNAKDNLAFIAITKRRPKLPEILDMWTDIIHKISQILRKEALYIADNCQIVEDVDVLNCDVIRLVLPKK